MFRRPLSTSSHDDRYYLCGNECSEAEVHKPPVPPGALTSGRLSTQKQLSDVSVIQTLEMKILRINQHGCVLRFVDWVAWKNVFF